MFADERSLKVLLTFIVIWYRQRNYLMECKVHVFYVSMFTYCLTCWDQGNRGRFASTQPASAVSVLYTKHWRYFNFQTTARWTEQLEIVPRNHFDSQTEILLLRSIVLTRISDRIILKFDGINESDSFDTLCVWCVRWCVWKGWCAW